MNKLSIKLKNCFGIKELEEEFSFEHSKVNVIYAKNGLMKTSFAKVFKKFEEGKEAEIKDHIFGATPIVKEIKVDGVDIQKDNIFVIKSFEISYESSSIASLLIDDDLKGQLEEVLSLRTEIFKVLENKSGLKILKGTQKTPELEPHIIEDFSFEEKSFIQNLEQLEFSDIKYDFSNIKYAVIFDKSVLNKIKQEDFQNKIEDFLSKSDEIYAEYQFFDKGKFTLPKLKDIQKKLKGNSYFVKGNKVVLNGADEFSSEEDLGIKIKEIDDKLQSTDEFKAIEKLLSDAKGMLLKDIIESNPDIIQELKLVKLKPFRKKLWLSYFKKEEVKLNELKTKYSALKSDIDELNIDETPWREAIKIFNERFTLPFKMSIENLSSSIMGESLPKIAFDFSEGEGSESVKLSREDLDISDTLSQGERRSLYLLNIIFDIAKREREGLKTLFIIDDIADSFDYKNKYAIIEYLKDISNIDCFYMIILSHNFDFYRTVSSRLPLDRDSKFHAINQGDVTKIKPEEYQQRPFDTWKDFMSSGVNYHKTYTSIDAKKHIMALIPFVRNLIEYGVDRQINELPGVDDDFILLTCLLHRKEGKTENITFEHLKKVFKEYIGRDDFDPTIANGDYVYRHILDLADNHVSDDDIKLENKIVLAMAIRLKAESFMKGKIGNSPEIFSWKSNRGRVFTGNKDDFLSYVDKSGNQTRKLFSGFKQIAENEEVKVLGSVNIMTPENIHLNSFMYEPILDMDVVELKSLYKKVKQLSDPI